MATNFHSGRILCWPGKHEPWYCYARTEKEELAAYLKLFKFIDEVAGYYQFGVGGEDQAPLLERAKTGDAKAARELIEIRSDDGYEYEDVHFSEVSDPFSDKF